MNAPRRPAVAVIGTGGTIASVGGDGLELVRYIDRKQMLPIDELLARTPELAQVADVTPIAHRVLQSHAIGPDDWLALVARIHALVAAGFAPGLVPPAQLEALNEAARAGVAVAHCSRVGSGRVPALGASHAQRSLTADNLTPQKARILLMLGLTHTRDRAELQRMFDTY